MKATKYSQYLQSLEELKFVDRPHWIYVIEAIFWSGLIIIAGFLVNQFIASRFIYPVLNQNIAADGLIINIAAYAADIILWGSVIFAIILFLNKIIFWASTYVFASERRLYMKTGMIRVLVNELSYDEIRKTDINYGLLGRFLGYGKLMMDARFVEDTDLPFTYSPEQFAKLVHYTNDLNNDVNLSYVTNGMKAKADQIIPEQSQAQQQVEPMHDQTEFLDHAFSKQEQEGIKNKKNQQDPIQNDFEDVVDVPDKTIEKPAATSLSKMNV